MTIQLTWDDLLIQKIAADDASRWLAEWSWLVTGRLYPVFFSRFGDWFLRRPDGSTERLDLLEGGLAKVADTPDEFDVLMHNPQWQEENLLSLFIYGFHEDGKIPSASQCYGFAPHPCVTGKIDPAHVMILDIGAWQIICSQMFRPRQ